MNLGQLSNFVYLQPALVNVLKYLDSVIVGSLQSEILALHIARTYKLVLAKLPVHDAHKCTRTVV